MQAFANKMLKGKTLDWGEEDLGTSKITSVKFKINYAEQLDEDVAWSCTVNMKDSIGTSASDVALGELGEYEIS